jgi:pyruvate kinase
MAALRPPCRLIGASPSPETTRQLALSWGVKPLVVGEYRTTDEMVRSVVESAAQHGLVHTGDTIGILAGSPTAPAGGTDVLRIVVVA